MAVNINSILASLDAEDPQARVKAVVLLVRSKDKRAIPFLERAASDDENPQVRYYARKGIQFILQNTVPEPSSGEPERRKPTAPIIDLQALSPEQVEQKLADPDQWTRLQIVRAIDLAKADQFVFHLIERLGIEENRQVLSALLMAVGALGGEHVAEAILPFLKDDDPRVRANAIEAVDAIGDSSVLVHLIPFLRDPDNRCRANAVLALRKYGRVNVFKTLEGMLCSKEVWMQDSATFVLGRMGSGNRTFELLDLALNSDYLVVRKQARQVLETIADRGVERARSLLDRLGSEDGRPGEEELFDKLERLSSLGKQSGPDGAAVPETKARVGGHGKSPAAALEALSKFSASHVEATEKPDGPQIRLENRAERALEALKALTVSTARKGRKADPTQFSGAFEAIQANDDE